jgi:thymidylate kinase
VACGEAAALLTDNHGALVAIDGVNGLAVESAARELARENRKRRAAVSGWDASGIFGELTIAEQDAGLPSARTLILLYAADLAFRLRWEIKPALAEGRMVIVAPYLSTAIAFGRAAGLDARSLTGMFAFAPEPAESRIVDAAAARSLSDRTGFVEFACDQLVGAESKAARRELIVRAARTLKTIAAVNRKGNR